MSIISTELDQDKIWIANFDIGFVNFSFYVEEIDNTILSRIVNIPKNTRYNDDGTPTDKMNKILKTIFKSGKTILHKNLNLTANCVKNGTSLDPETFNNMTDVLDEYSKYWDKCSYYVVEQQVSFRGKFNLKALKLGQHCQSYFRFRYGRFKKVIEFPAYHKTEILGSQKLNKGKCKNGKIKYRNIDKPARKKWSIEKAKEILIIRNETDSIILKPKKRGSPVKLDDYSDTLCQSAAFIYLAFVDKSI